MAEAFDPYFKWLGIPPEEQPPNLYRLLSVPLFVTDLDVISNAADRQMAHLRTYQAGRHSDASQQLLNEISAARVCLLNVQKKAAYDAQLRAALAPPPQTSAPVGRRTTMSAPRPVAAAPDPPIDLDHEFAPMPASRASRPARTKVASNWQIPSILGAAVIAVVMIAGLMLHFSRARPNSGTTTVSAAPQKSPESPVAAVPEPPSVPPADQSNSNPKVATAPAIPQVSPAANPPLPAVAPFNALQARAHQEAWAEYLGTTVEKVNSDGMQMILIPPGDFLMGSSEAEAEMGSSILRTEGFQIRLQPYECPQHRVVFSRPLRMSATEVTVGQFRKFVDATGHVTEAEKFGFGDSHLTVPDGSVTDAMRAVTWRTPGTTVTDDSPVSQVTWNDAVAFCNWLSGEEKLPASYRRDVNDGWVLEPHAQGYRLPTEAEWEYACRAGTTGQYSFGDDPAQLEQYGWYVKNSAGAMQPVGMKRPNAFGLYDMHGNIGEWCQDWNAFYSAEEKSPSVDPIGPASGARRAIRGGYWRWVASSCRCAYRLWYEPTIREAIYGFRVVRELDVVPAKEPPRNGAG